MEARNTVAAGAVSTSAGLTTFFAADLLPTLAEQLATVFSTYWRCAITPLRMERGRWRQREMVAPTLIGQRLIVLHQLSFLSIYRCTAPSSLSQPSFFPEPKHPLT